MAASVFWTHNKSTVCPAQKWPLTLTWSARHYLQFDSAWGMSKARVKAAFAGSAFISLCCYFWSQQRTRRCPMLCSQLRAKTSGCQVVGWDRPRAEMARACLFKWEPGWCPQLFHCPIVWMELLLLDLELSGLKSKLTCLHLRLRPNVCFYLTVSFHVWGTRRAL